jgi:hypothetical protein
MKKHSLLDRPHTTNARQSEAVVGICWYSSQDWESIKADAADPEVFENTFSEWEAMALQSFARLRRAYPKLVKVNVTTDQ